MYIKISRFLIIVALLLNGSIFPPLLANVAAAPTESIIIDHTSANITKIPPSAILAAKANLHIAYGHTSHGAQISRGMDYLVGFANGGGLDLSLQDDIFAYNNGGTGGALDMDEFVDSDLTRYPDWVNDTIAYLGPSDNRNPEHADVNVVMWAWCYWQNNLNAQNIYDYYLTPMSQLETEYPDITFVYMTCILRHERGLVEYPNTRAVNDEIRDFCIKNKKVLYDWADIESWDPDGNYYEFADEEGSYYSSANDTIPDGNWAVDWRNAHTKGPPGGDWYYCSASDSHTDDLIGDLKGYAAWWLWARLAGWDGKNNTGENTKAPARFTISDVTVTPNTCKLGEEVVIAATVNNTGSTNEPCEVVLTINGVKENSKSVTVMPGGHTQIKFTVSKSAPDTYKVEVNGISASFVVEKSAEPMIETTTTVPATPVSKAWQVIWLIVGIIIGLLVLGGAIYGMMRRK